MCKDCLKSAFDKNSDHHCKCQEKKVCCGTTNNEKNQKDTNQLLEEDEDDESQLIDPNSKFVSAQKSCCSTNQEVTKNWWSIFREEKWDIILSLTVALPLILNFIGMIIGIHIIPENKYLFFILATILVFFALPKKVYSAYVEIKKKEFSHIILQVFAILTVYIYSSIVVLFNIKLKFDFDCLPFILIIFAISDIIENRVVDNINKNIAKETKISEKSKIIKIEGEKQILIWPEELKIGEEFLVKNGQQVPLDAIVVDNESIFDTSAITGEIKPYEPLVNELVLSGSINKGKVVKLRVQEVVADSLLATLDRELENLQAKETPTYKLGQKFLKAILVTIVAVALINFGVSWLIFGFERAILTSIAVILITCPCGIAAGLPLLFSIYMSELLKNKILVRDLVFIEQINKINAFAFDKTGTITNSIADVYKIEGETKYLKYLKAMEHYSTHPIAQSIVKHLTTLNLPDVTFNHINELSGKGITAQIDNLTFYVGSQKLLVQLNIEYKPTKEEQKLANQGFIVIYFICGREIVNKVYLNSKLISGAKEMISNLNNLGTTYLITGDNELVGNYIAKLANIQKSYCNVSPLNKLDIIKQIQQSQNVLYAGDGINDSLSLKQANLSLSFSNGSDVAKQSAKALLLKQDLSLVYKLVRFSQVTLKNMNQAMWITYVYNLITMFLAIASLVSLEFAPFAEVFSVAIIALNVYRLKWKAQKIFKTK